MVDIVVFLWSTINYVGKPKIYIFASETTMR